MKTIKFLYLAGLLVFLNALSVTGPVSAHGDEPRIEISADSLNPGDTLDIRGVDFEFEEIVVLDLVSPQMEIAFGEVLADVEGIFLLTITLPVDIPEGTYVMRATTDDHVLESPPINIWGSANLGGGEEGPWEEGDGLLQPMPTAMPAAPTPLAQTTPSESEPAPHSSPSMVGVVLVLLGILLVAMIRVVKM